MMLKPGKSDTPILLLRTSFRQETQSSALPPLTLTTDTGTGAPYRVTPDSRPKLKLRLLTQTSEGFCGQTQNNRYCTVSRLGA
jgi:hypothetical protein